MAIFSGTKEYFGLYEGIQVGLFDLREQFLKLTPLFGKGLGLTRGDEFLCSRHNQQVSILGVARHGLPIPALLQLPGVGANHCRSLP